MSSIEALGTANLHLAVVAALIAMAAAGAMAQSIAAQPIGYTAAYATITLGACAWAVRLWTGEELPAPAAPYTRAQAQALSAETIAAGTCFAAGSWLASDSESKTGLLGITTITLGLWIALRERRATQLRFGREGETQTQ